MKTYEGTFIFERSLTEEALDEAVSGLRAELERFGGQVQSATRLGKRHLARPIQRHESGHFVVIDFAMAGDQLAPFKDRLKRNGQVLRAQFLCKASPAAAPVKGA